MAASCKKNNLTINSSKKAKNSDRYTKEIFTSVKIDSNISYGKALNISGVQEELFTDIYEPDNDTAKKRAIIIFVHGGGWLDHNKDDGKEFCTLFSKKGYVTASINYRLGLEYPINDKTRGEAVYRGVQDIKAAVRYVRSNASLFKIDTGQVFIGGYSSGAVNAVHAAYLDETEVPQNIDLQRWGGLNNSGNNFNSSSKVQGVFSIAGAIADTNWIQVGDPPIILVHGKTDMFLPYTSGLDYLGIYDYGAMSIIKRADFLKIPADILTYENIAHDEYLNAIGFTKTTNAINDFLYTKIIRQ